MQRAADALATFSDGLVGKANDDERLLARRDAHLHLDGARFDADKRYGGNLTVHAPRPNLTHPRLAEVAGPGYCLSLKFT